FAARFGRELRQPGSRRSGRETADFRRPEPASRSELTASNSQQKSGRDSKNAIPPTGWRFFCFSENAEGRTHSAVQAARRAAPPLLRTKPNPVVRAIHEEDR